MVMDDVRLNEASEWFVRLREAAVTNEVISAWLQWCKDHPENAAAFREIQEIWSLAKDAGISEWPSAAQIGSDEYTGEVSVIEWQQSQSQHHRQAQQRRPNWRRAWTYACAIAASLVLSLGIWSSFRDWNVGPTAVVYATERAAKREVGLADGSIVSLGGASTIRVAYETDRRNIELESGEVHFKVKPDKARPFVVHSKNLRVTAVGTAFTVRTDDVRTIVSVTDGVVEIAAAGVPLDVDHQPMHARAGEQVTYDTQRRSATKQPGDDAIALGWQEGTLSYVDEPLRSVIARINRNSTNEIVVMDAAIGDLRFTGTVHEKQVPEWALSLERVFPVRVVIGADGHIEVAPR
jgi:transmembrane sensor